MSILDRVRPDILALEAYLPASWKPGLVRLHANENPWRPEADLSTGGLNRYPEPQSADLARAMASLYAVDAACVLPTRGSDEGIDLLVRAFCAAGRDRVLLSPPTFPMYGFAARVQGAGIVTVPLVEPDFALDVEAVCAAIDDTVKLVFVCAPNNPTGGHPGRQVILGLAERIGERALVVVDEAYIEFCTTPSLVDEVAGRDNLAVLRTLSKAYGLAGARCGAVIASPTLIDLLRRLLPPYAVTTHTIETVTARLQIDGIQRSAGQVERLLVSRQSLANALAGLSAITRVWPSEANFLLVHSQRSSDLLRLALDAGLLVRDVGTQPGLAGCLRVTVGLEEDNARLLAAWSQA
ncbi:MAG: histidinol-phosphate transaminase [Steroidobacteraceae bacterium]